MAATFARLCQQVDQTQKELEAEIRQLTVKIDRLETVQSRSKSLRFDWLLFCLLEGVIKVRCWNDAERQAQKKNKSVNGSCVSDFLLFLLPADIKPQSWSGSWRSSQTSTYSLDTEDTEDTEDTDVTDVLTSHYITHSALTETAALDRSTDQVLFWCSSDRSSKLQCLKCENLCLNLYLFFICSF